MVVKCVYHQLVVVVVHHTYRQNVPMLFTCRVLRNIQIIQRQDVDVSADDLSADSSCENPVQ